MTLLLWWLVLKSCEQMRVSLKFRIILGVKEVGPKIQGYNYYVK